MIHLPRHLRDVYKWIKEKTKMATSTFGLRKSFLPKLDEKPLQQSLKKTVQEKKRKDYHWHQRCPINGYNSVVKCLSNHIQKVHKEIKKGSPVYKQILREARSLKTCHRESLRKAQGNPGVKGEGSFSNSTEEGSMGDSSVQDLPRLGQFEEEDNEVREV